jgi:hypothetical protein
MRIRITDWAVMGRKGRLHTISSIAERLFRCYYVSLGDGIVYDENDPVICYAIT